MGNFFYVLENIFLCNDIVVLEWESIFIIIRYDKINLEL